jgi:hypothetical protein
MKTLSTVLLLTSLMIACTDPTRVLTNKPKSEEQKQQEKEQRKQQDKANTEALRDFRITDHAGKKGQTEAATASKESKKTEGEGREDEAKEQKEAQP